MTSIQSISRQLSQLDLKKQQSSSSLRSTHSKQQSSQSSSNVAKLLTKYAAPNAFQPKSTHARNGSATAAALAAQSQSQPQPQPPMSPGRGATQATIDIGRYDGGFEIDNEKRGEKIYGEAAEALALDSSVSR